MYKNTLMIIHLFLLAHVAIFSGEEKASVKPGNITYCCLFVSGISSERNHNSRWLSGKKD